MAKTLQVLSLRFLNSPLTCVCPQLSFSVGTLVQIPFPGLIHESGTSKRFSICTSVVLEVGPSLPVLWCCKGVQENGLGISPLNMTSVVTGDTGSAVFVLDTNTWKLGLFRGSKTRSSVAIPAFSRFCPHDGRMISTLPAHPWHTASP